MIVYNTLTRKKENFNPIKNNKINFFVCGPTVYDYPHLGHAKAYINYDIIVEYFRSKEYKVYYLQNITDIDNKIIERANEKGKSVEEISRKFEKIYYVNELEYLNLKFYPTFKVQGIKMRKNSRHFILSTKEVKSKINNIEIIDENDKYGFYKIKN